MKLSVILTVQFVQSFSKLMQGSILKVNVKDVFRLKKIAVKMQDEIKHYEEIRKELNDELSEKDDKGNPIFDKNDYVLTDENKASLIKKLDELADEEIDLGDKFPFASFEKLDLTISDLIVLDDLIAEPV